MALYEPVIEALNARETRYVVVGGMAVLLQGYARFTADLDLSVDLAGEEPARVIEVLAGLGMKPIAPVDPQGFADPDVRASWISEKNMQVFSMRDPSEPMRVVDLFVDNPIDFEGLWERSEILKLGDTDVRVASIPDLIEMKRSAGRSQDHTDIEELEAILRDRSDD